MPKVVQNQIFRGQSWKLPITSCFFFFFFFFFFYWKKNHEKNLYESVVETGFRPGKLIQAYSFKADKRRPKRDTITTEESSPRTFFVTSPSDKKPQATSLRCWLNPKQQFCQVCIGFNQDPVLNVLHQGPLLDKILDEWRGSRVTP